MQKFNLGDLVFKVKGSHWQGKIVGTYSSSLTLEGYAVESELEKGSVQIYPASALALLRVSELEGGTVERTGFELDNGTNPNTFQCANTVEKCCNHDRPKPFTCYCPCHNKKEACNACSMQGKNAEWCHFNRETPKSAVTISERIESILERFEVKQDRAAAALRDIATDFRDAKAHETN